MVEAGKEPCHLHLPSSSPRSNNTAKMNFQVAKANRAVCYKHLNGPYRDGKSGIARTTRRQPSAYQRGSAMEDNTTSTSPSSVDSSSNTTSAATFPRKRKVGQNYDNDNNGLDKKACIASIERSFEVLSRKLDIQQIIKDSRDMLFGMYGVGLPPNPNPNQQSHQEDTERSINDSSGKQADSMAKQPFGR